MDKMEHFQAVDLETGEVLHTLQISDPEAIKTDTAIAFTEADTKSNIESGENIPTLFGKIKKWFKELKAVAFSGSYNDLDNKPDLKTVATSGDYNDLDNKPDLKDVATSGDYADLINTPDVFSTTTNGLVPMSTDVEGFLKGDGTWVVPKGGTDQQFLTWEEWEALPDTKYTDNIRYIITDKTYRDGIIQDDKTGDTITWSSNKIVNYISQLPAGFQIPDGWTWTSDELLKEYYIYSGNRCSISLEAGVNGPSIYIYQYNEGTCSIAPNNVKVYGTEYNNYIFRETSLKADMIKRYDRTSGTGSTDIKYDLKFPDLSNGETAIIATTTMTGGMKVTGRWAGNGDDEGIIIGQCSNGYAGLTLGSNTGRRSVFYLNNSGEPFWRYNNGSSSFDLRHPGKAGTIATTSDIPTYNFAGTTFNSGNSGTAEHNCNNMLKNGNYYYTSNGPATSIGASTNDGAVYVQSYSDSWVGQIAQDYRNGNLFVRGKNNGTWQAWKKIAMESPTAITVTPHANVYANGNQQICEIRNGIVVINLTWLIRTAFTLNANDTLATMTIPGVTKNFILQARVQYSTWFTCYYQASSKKIIVLRSSGMTCSSGHEISLCGVTTVS